MHTALLTTWILFFTLQKVRHNRHHDSEAGEIRRQSGEHCSTANCRIVWREAEDGHATQPHAAAVSFAFHNRERKAIYNAKILIYFSNKIHGNHFIKQHSETVIVWNCQNANCSLRKVITVSFVIIFGTLSFPMPCVFLLSTTNVEVLRVPGPRLDSKTVQA